MTPADFILHAVGARIADPTPVAAGEVTELVTHILTQHFPDTPDAEIIAELAVALVAERTTQDVPSQWAWHEIDTTHRRLTELLARREDRRQRAMRDMSR